MIDIGFVNLILIITDNVSDFGEYGNLYLSVRVTPDSPRLSTFIVSGSPRPSAFIEFFDHSNSMPNFFANILANSFGNFGMDTFSNLVVDLVSPLIMLFLSDLPTLGRFLRDNFPTLVVNTLFSLSRDIPPDHPLSTGCLFPLSLSLYGNFTTFDYPPSLDCSLFLSLSPLGNSTLDHPPSLCLFPLLLSLGISIYDW